MAQTKEENKIPANEVNETEIDNLSDAEFKTLVIRMLRDFIEYNNNINEEMKVTLSEIKKNLQETNSEGKEAGIQINDLAHKEEINIQPETERKKKNSKR